MHFLRNEKRSKKISNKNILTKLQVAASLVLFLVVFTPAYGMSWQDYQNQINSLDSQIAAANNKIDELNSKEKTLANEVAVLDAQINAIQTKINVFQEQINISTNQINSINKQIGQAETDLKEQQKLMGEYLKTMYIEGQVSTIELIAKSDNFSDFVNKSEYMGTMQENVQDTANKIVELKKTLNQQKRNLETIKAKNEQLKTEQVIAQNGIQSQKNAKNYLIQETNGQEANYQATIKAAQKKETEAWASYQQAIQGATSSGGSTYTGGGGSGYLSLPVNGYISQRYGTTDYTQYQYKSAAGTWTWGCTYGGTYPNCTIHNGWDIASYSGDPVHAAAAGYIIDRGSAYNSGGWGNWIAIKHPNGLVTLYAHLTSFAVSVNQGVVKGQVIGYEGSTGNSTGAHVHFSVFTSFILYNVSGYHGPAYGGTVDPGGFL